MKKLLGFLAAGLLTAAFAAEIPILEISKWNLDGLSAAKSGSSLRLVENGPKAYGTAKTRVAVGKNKYLQIIAGASENPEHFITVSNVSGGKTPKGVIFQGINTFALPDKNFTLALTLRGNKGTAPGGWYNINTIKTMAVPTGGLTVTANKAVLQVNDTFKVRYYAGEKLAEAAPEVKAFESSTMSAISFGNPIILNDEGKNGDEKAGDFIYSADVKISGKTPNPGKSAILFSIILPNDSSSYGTPSFAFDIKSSNMIRKTKSRLTPLAAKYRAMWEKATAGAVNLAAGKKVIFSSKPNFYLTAVGKSRQQKNNDAFDLTDGKLSRRGDDVLRFDHNAVGWRTSADLSGGIDLLIDLGKVEPVAKAVIRINCGDKQKQVQRSPRKFAVLVSKDGSSFYPANAPMIKLQPGEKDQSNFINQYYLEENDSDIFCYPFELAVNAPARYVMLRIVPDGGNLYSDELAIIKAADPAQVSEKAYSGAPEKRLTGGVVLTPAQNGNFYVAENLPAPNYFAFRDLRESTAKAALQMVMEVPESIVCLNSDAKQQKIQLDGRNYIRYSFPIPADSQKIASYMEHQAVFLQAKGKVPAGSKAYFYAAINGRKSHIAERDIEVITIPEAPEMFKGITVLSRMSIGDQTFPGYYSNLKMMGFSGVHIYPYMYQRTGVDKFSEEYCSSIEKARQAGYKIVFGYNGLLDMYRYNKHNDEVYCQDIPQKAIKCPTYRGEFYYKELAKITRAVAKFRPDYIQWDIEIWGHSMPFVRNCSRCKALQKKSGKSWEDFLDDVSVELNADLNKAVAEGVKQQSKPQMPLLYNYNRQPLSSCYHGFEKWSLNGKFVDGGQPSLYVAGSELRVHNNIAGNFALQSSKSQRLLVPILTPGTYGAYAPFRLEQMIYETMLNGSRGFFYYPWRGFISPIYFYYHAKAMQNVIKYQSLILTGEIFKPSCSEEKITVSGVKNAAEALILLGNYQSAPEKVSVTLPFANAEVFDVLNKKSIPQKELKALQVPNAKVRLLYIKKK